MSDPYVMAREAELFVGGEQDGLSFSGWSLQL